MTINLSIEEMQVLSKLLARISNNVDVQETCVDELVDSFRHALIESRKFKGKPAYLKIYEYYNSKANHLRKDLINMGAYDERFER